MTTDEIINWHRRTAMNDKNQIYWAYNLPLQVWPDEDGRDARILNYMPRKECVIDVSLSEVIGSQSRDEFFESAALRLENLARLMRACKNDSKSVVYYHDAGMETEPTND